MKLVSLHLNNIRSYKDERIDFRSGVTLFEGDIGSGKSSILNAVEFALFGLGDQLGSHLLRVGEKEGSVELTIEVNDKEYTFGRGLTKKKSNVTQDQCYIVEDGVQTRYNATDMKRRALQILDFKEPTSPRSQSVIYRYAVFTPQEQMREVIRQKPESRKETLRKALGVEEYSIAAGNADKILSNLRSEARALEKSRGEVELVKGRIDEEEKNIKELNEKIAEAQESLRKLEAEKLRVQAELGEKKRDEAASNVLVQRLKLLEQEKKRLEQDLVANTSAHAESRQKLLSAKEAKTRLEKLTPIYEEYKAIRKELPRLQSKHDLDKSLKQRIEVIRTKINSKREELEKQLSDTDDEINDLNGDIDELGEELQKLPQLSAEIAELENEVTALDSLREDNNQKQGQHTTTLQEIRQLEAEKTERSEEWRTISSIGVGATCPHCQQKLSETHYRLLESKIHREIEKLDKEIADKKGASLELSEKIKDGKAKQTELERKEKKLQRLRLELVVLEKDRQTREKYVADVEGARAKKSGLEALLLNDSFAEKQKEEISILESQTNELKPYIQKYDESRTRGAQLEEMRVEEEYNDSKAIADRLPELTTTQTKLESEKASLDGKLRENAENLSEVNTELKKYEGLEAELSKLLLEEKTLLQEDAMESTRIKNFNSSIESAEQRVERMKEDKARHEKNLLEAEGLQIVETWLREILIPSLQTIEKNILLSLNQEFNKMFKRWFSELIESEELQGLIDEDFTPTVEQSGYELDVESLSGGEKTSVALAYRLALNTIVKQVTNTMRGNLLILDEPTDGFSKEQLFKMRDILNELDCSQVILVSHEKELESVADYIYRVRKEGNISTVSPPS